MYEMCRTMVPDRSTSLLHVEKVTLTMRAPKRKRPPVPQPTEAELELLRVLWSRGPSTVREVHASLSSPTARRVAYTTVLKLLQIMTEKGLVTRDTSERSHVYQVSLPEGDTKKQLVKDLLERAFGGSAKDIVVRALEAAPASKEEREQIRRILDAMEETQE